MFIEMKFLRSTLAMILVLLSLCFLFAGCGKETSTQTAKEDETASADIRSVATATPEPVPTFSPNPNLNASESLVGLLIPNTDGLLTRMAQHGFLRTAENLGYPAIVYQADSSSDTAKLVEQAIEDGCSGLLIWADSPEMLAAVAKARSSGVPVVVPYYGTEEEVEANLVPDPYDFAPEAARIMCAQLESRKKSSGIIVICGANLEPEIADAFESKLTSDYKQYSVVRFEQELTEENISEFIRKHADLVGVLSLDETSGKIWNKSCDNVQALLRQEYKDANSDNEEALKEKPYYRSAVILTLDYTEAHLAWVRDGLTYGVIARPYYDSTAKSMAVLDSILRGLPIQKEVRLDAPVIRKNAVDKYISIALEAKEWFSE